MAVLNVDILRLYNNAFGQIALPFPGGKVGGSVSDAGEFEEFDLIPGEQKDPPLRGSFNFKSPQGGSYFLPVKMGVNPTDLYQLPNEPIMSIRGSKMLKVTPIRRKSGGRGTVKEERSLNDYEITIRGLAINEDENDYPESQIREIRKICESTGVVYLTSYFSKLFNISKVSIKDFDFPRFPANSLRVQPYVINCISDMDFDDYLRLIG